ncbi:CatB-related O-acetyltransferase [Photobacterium rosenbergii]|uniref:CatB-related O-acetyltransferase n=1 Tax=Photobacterium rosenbergii TaxID=294936 RepID=UPI001C99822A|nr:CatB-related O-acetyltransferase [Photobacterium rosenbergii]MBY5944717.1 CatB-related O-acetyltransferase [Photobacterium rosenbergii]
MNPEKLYPIEGFNNTLLLKPLLAQSDIDNITVGDYTYYSDFEDPSKFFAENVLYNFGFSGTSLHIGKFCAIAHGTKFIMADANHATSGVTTFPFAVFGGKWADSLPLGEYPFKQYKDIQVGNDVWFGNETTVMPGVTIGNGAIIGSKAVVTKDVPAYAIVGGNPAKVIRLRYSADEVAKLEQLAWWDWPIEHIEQAIPLLVKGGVAELSDYAEQHNLASL